MLLFPLWIALMSVPCVYVAARYTRNGLATLFVSFSFLLSGTIVLLSFSRLMAKVSAARLGGLLVLEVGRLSVLSSLLFLVCVIPFLIYYLTALDGTRLPKAAALVHLLVFSALGSFFAADLLSFVLLFEAVPLLALALVMLDGKVENSPYQHLLYFVPLPLLLLFMGVAAEGRSDLAAITWQTGAILLLAGVFAARLLLFPFGWPATQCLAPAGRSAASYALSSLPAVAFLALLKFLPHSRFLGQVILVLAAFSMIVWAFLCYRRTSLSDVTLSAYLAQTAIVAVMLVYQIIYAGSKPGLSFLVLGNHLMSGLGVLVCASLDHEKRGRLGNAALVFFAYCMLGLPPSPGFFGRLILFKGSFSSTDFPGHLLRLSFLVNLFIVYCQSRCLAPVIDRIKTGPKSPRSLTMALFLLAGCLLLSMVFATQLKNYLTISTF